MVVSTGHPKRRSAGAGRRPFATRIPHDWAQDADWLLAQPLFTDDLLIQIQSLGLSPAASTRFLQAVRSALGQALGGLDHHAWANASPAEQVSMLLPRFDIGPLARATRLSKAEVQSALAVVITGFVTLTRHTRH